MLQVRKKKEKGQWILVKLEQSHLPEGIPCVLQLKLDSRMNHTHHIIPNTQ